MSLDFSVSAMKRTTVYDGNVTHNLAPMFRLAGVYDVLYNSKDKRIGDYYELLKQGLAKMIVEQDKFKALNPENGWGTYECAVQFLKEVVATAEQYPDGIIWSWK